MVAYAYKCIALHCYVKEYIQVNMSATFKIRNSFVFFVGYIALRTNMIMSYILKTTLYESKSA